MPTTTADTKAQKIQEKTVKADLEARQQGAEMEDAGARPQPGRAGIPSSPSGKAETRLFQVAPGNKVWLTKKKLKHEAFSGARPPESLSRFPFTCEHGNEIGARFGGSDLACRAHCVIRAALVRCGWDIVARIVVDQLA
jgi:hypothetical protein